VIKRISAMLLAAAVILTVALPVAATTSNSLSPATQSHAHGVASQWSGSWSGTGPFSWTLYHGDGTSTSAANVAYTSHTFPTYAFFPCTTTTFTQHTRVTDQVGPLNSNDTTATETGGNPC
jgi:exo-beta-1,3-glucanase (GH17 family)